MSYYLEKCRELIDYIYRDCSDKDLINDTKDLLENCDEEFLQRYRRKLEERIKTSSGIGVQLNKDGLWYIEDLSGEDIVLDHWNQHRAYHIDAGKRFNYTCQIKNGRKVVTEMERVVE